jgi:hypothetical protein
MAREPDLTELVSLQPDERLLGEDLAKLPDSVGEPDRLPDSPARRRIVGTGAAMTGVSLVGGVGLMVLGVVEAIDGASAALVVAAFVIGILLVATHWGWVHVAELTANNLEGRRNTSVQERRLDWLRSIEPYPRWEVSTRTAQDGSISIVTVRYGPVPSREGKFTFVREEVACEVHSGDETAAAVAERAELLRRSAAADTERERQRYQVGHDAYERARLADADEQERLAAVRAASEALSEQINSNLRNPPLVE